MTTILGIDPGTLITGYAIKNQHTVLDYGVIKPNKGLILAKRYQKIYEGVTQLVKAYVPDEIAIESQFTSKNVQSAMKVAMAKAMVLLVASLHEIPVFEYAPTVIKRAVTGIGSAKKYQVQQMIKHLLKLPQIVTEDTADALAVILCHEHYKKGQKQLTRIA